MRALLAACLVLCAATHATAQCLGDFNGDGVVGIDELIVAVGNALAGCEASGPRFVDNGDGTVSDHRTGLVWEKKIELDTAPNPANLHDANNPYNWSGSCSGLASKRCQPNPAAAATCAAQVDGDLTGCDECMDGEGTCSMAVPALTTIFDWVNLVNAARFAGHDDWRVPTREELLSIVNYGTTSPPAAFPAFHGASCGAACTDIADPACSCTALFTWSASAFTSFQGEAWEVDFNIGSTTIIEKSGLPPQPMFARAVRGAMRAQLASF